MVMVRGFCAPKIVIRCQVEKGSRFRNRITHRFRNFHRFRRSVYTEQAIVVETVRQRKTHCGGGGDRIKRVIIAYGNNMYVNASVAVVKPRALAPEMTMYIYYYYCYYNVCGA